MMLDTDLNRLIEKSHSALDAFVRGDAEAFKNLYSRNDDIIVANPFGPPAKGWAQATVAIDGAAANYSDGEALGFDRISEYGTDTLACVMEIEHYRARVRGADALTSFSACVTTTFRREDGLWR